MRNPRLSVAVLVELAREPASGGHVKCWERIAHAAAGSSAIDLTIYTVGRRRRVEPIADNVRFVALRPVLSTRPVARLVGGVDPSDAAPYHPGLARLLPQHDVWHLTHSFSFAATALRMPHARRRPMVASIHTDVPLLVQTYTDQIVARLPAAARELICRAGLARLPAAVARRRRNRILRHCHRVLVFSTADHPEIATAVPEAALSPLRRGVDTSQFHPGRTDLAWLARRYGVPTDRTLVLFVGRVDATKNAYTLATAIHRVNASGQGTHLLMAGTGADSGRISALLRKDVTFLGHLSQDKLARVYPSCDLFAFPSMSETAGNVVAEAMASGLPVLLPAGARTAQWLRSPGTDGVLIAGSSDDDWADALAALVADPLRRQEIGRLARKTAETAFPSWADVLRDDLIPVWRAAAGASLRTTISSGAATSVLRERHR